jgi:hypothetical protein
VILALVNLDFARPQSGTVELGLDGLGLPDDAQYEAIDLIEGTTELWRGSEIEFELDPAATSARVLQLRPLARTARQFEHF